MKPITLDIPIFLEMGKKKPTRFSLNLNFYRNAHFHTLNNLKILFGEVIQIKLKPLPKMIRVNLTYTLFFGSKRSVDLSNICSIVDKFFCDTLVDNGKLPDDNSDIISEINYRWGGIDKENPRIEVTLSNIEIEKEEPMKIICTQEDIKNALLDYLHKEIVLKHGQNVSFTFNYNDIQAEVTVNKTVPQTLAPAVEAQPAPVSFVPVSEPEKLTERLPEKKEAALTPMAPSAPAAPSASEAPKGKSLFGGLTTPIHDPK